MNYSDIEKVNKELKTTDIKGKDYAEVNQRIKGFRQLFPEGFILTRIESLENGMVIITAEVGKYEEGQKIILAKGTAYEKEGSTFINKTSFIENCETSAVGRALGMLGIGIDTSVASYEEVGNAIAQQESTMKITKVKANALKKRCENDNVNIEKLCEQYKVNSLEELTNAQHNKICELLQKNE